MIVHLIRHAETASNAARLYLGQKDELLCPAGIARARATRAPDACRLCTSPLRRCIDTAAILYPHLRPHVVPGLIEIDFGAFEGKTHAQLIAEQPAYQTWLDSGGTAPIPGGETMDAFRLRTRAAFLSCADGPGPLAVVAHGGTIMALLAELADPPRSFYDGFTPNCGIVTCEWNGSRLLV